MKLVSVIMPYFKKKEYVLKSLNSIISQSYKNLEIIIIDDELSQESQDLMKKLSNLDKRIKIISNQSNLGAGISRNNGMQIAKGEYIAFCDCDDVWLRNKLEVQLNIWKIIV
jgi:teichuronic acid biosynthesis glycosyltransferase TuaG